MHTFDELSELTKGSVEKLQLPDEPRLLYLPIRYTLESGGKRIRPLLTLASCALFTDEVEKALHAAMGIEVFHNFTLLHDDIMDKAPKRRGRDTVHRKWNDNVAILSGDAMLIYAYVLISKSEPDELPRLMEVFNRTALGVCEGQQYDMNFETTLDVTVEQYLRMIELKTSVLLGGAAQIGAIAGGAGEAVARSLYEFGINLGLAFQLQDDVLDTYGDEKTFGKSIGGDILSNKKTFLLIKALELSSAPAREKLTEWISRSEFDRDEKIAAVKEIYNQTGVKELTESLVDSYFAKAISILDALSVDEVRKEPLREITRLLMKRDK